MNFDQITRRKAKLTTVFWTSLLTLTGITCIPANAKHDEVADQQNPVNISIYTHGDTQFARFGEDGKVTGPLQDLLQCAAEKFDLQYDFKFAPLSRATGLLDTLDHMAWFPSGPREDEERAQRLIGPLGEVKILWYQRKSSDLDISSPDFKANAVVSAYNGSVFEDILQNEGYNFVQGSADHNRLIYTLLAGDIDAFLAVDFRFKLDDNARNMLDNRVKTTIRTRIPIHIGLSKHLTTEHPELSKSFKTEVMNCYR